MNLSMVTPARSMLDELQDSSPSQLDGCSNITYGNTYYMSILGIFAFLAFVSMLCATFIALTIFYNEKLRIHPSKLIGYMCLSEAMASFNALLWVANPETIICYFGLHYVFSWSLFGE